MNDELKRTWKEMFVAHLMVITKNFPGEIEKYEK
jgi:hypothetical protein